MSLDDLSLDHASLDRVSLDHVSIDQASLDWNQPGPIEILRWPLPDQGFGHRLLIRGFALMARRQMLALRGIEHVLPDRDPFILAANHSTRLEAVSLPSLLFLRRGGRLIHFLADWNFRLIPGIGLLYRHSQAVTVTRKPARPRVLNALKPLYRQRVAALEQARALLQRGGSIGLFPEGTVNRDAGRLLPGRRGAARLSLETGVPVVPVGIRFPQVAPGRAIPDGAVMDVQIGAPLAPPRCASPPAPLAQVRAFHATIMREIGRLSGKAWEPPAYVNMEARDAR
jgi:1-acyl-sn-glycerol-3-phosphate acyltransferase